MKTLITTALTYLVFASTTALYAGNEGGAGGDGILLGNNLYLLDLVESGVETSPNFDMSLEADPVFGAVIERLRKPLGQIDDDQVVKLVAIKLIEVSKFNTPLALTLLQAIEQLRWVSVNHALVDIKDEDTVLEIGSGKLIQLAIRRLHSVQVSRDSWDKLNEKHRAALIFHEAVYAMLVPERIDTEEHKKFSRQSSPKAREIVGLLFSTSMDLSPLTKLIGDAIGLHFGSKPLPPENYYENFNEIGRGVAWLHSGNFRVKLKLQYPFNSRAFYGQWHNPLEGATGKDFCNDVSSLLTANNELQKLNKFNSLRMTLGQDFSADGADAADVAEVNWGVFQNQKQMVNNFLDWENKSLNGETFLILETIWSWSEGNAPQICEENINELFSSYKNKSSKRNVFWRP